MLLKRLRKIKVQQKKYDYKKDSRKISNKLRSNEESCIKLLDTSNKLWNFHRKYNKAKE